MKKIVFLIIAIINSISIADAAVRDINSPKRTGTTQTTLSSRQSGTQSRPDTTSARTAKNKTIQSIVHHSLLILKIHHGIRAG